MKKLMMKMEYYRMTTRKNHIHRREGRQKDAQARQAFWAGMTPEDQLKALDDRLGAGMGATKQRARITLFIEERDKPKVQKKEKPQRRRQRKEK
jgi:hypothetical protein